MSICAICGTGVNINQHHVEEKRMGGRGSKAPDSAHITVPLCAGRGSGNTDPTSCHGAVHARLLSLRIGDDGALWYCIASTDAGIRFARLLRARGVPARDGQWRRALYEDCDPDAVDMPRGEELV